MVIPRVKEKLPLARWFLPGIAALTFVTSWAGAFPAILTETWYSRGVYPWISTVAGTLADAVPFSWLDLVIPIGLVSLVAAVHFRKFLLVANGVAVLYLIFFWSWGLNYHRQPLASKLSSDPSRTETEAIGQFARHTAERVNQL